MQKYQVPGLYFQRQSYFSSQCGVCALNNLIGDQVFNSKQLTQICNSLSTNLINPYKSVFGGDYDVTVLINALRQYQMPVRWIKKNQKIQEVVKIQGMKGILINSEQEKSATVYFKKLIKQSGRHWVCLKKYANFFVLLDSLKTQPQYLSVQKAQQYLEKQRSLGSTILIIELQPFSPQKVQQQQQQQPK